MVSEQPSNDENTTPAWLQAVDHTADRGIIVQAADLEELFARAAWGMFSIVTDLKTVKPAQSEKMVVTAPDREALLVRWLSELNFRHVTRHRLFCRFQIMLLSERELVAEVGGENIEPERHTNGTRFIRKSKR
jgi:SHS2 domain-containing protein